MRVWERGERPLPRHVRQHPRIKSIKFDPASPGAIHNELAELVPALIIAFSIAEGFACLKFRPSRVVDAVDNLEVQRTEDLRMFVRTHRRLPSCPGGSAYTHTLSVTGCLFVHGRVIGHCGSF